MALLTSSLSDLLGTGSTTDGAAWEVCHFHIWQNPGFSQSTMRSVLPAPTGPREFGRTWNI